EPGTELGETGLERHLRPIPEYRRRAGDVGKTVADVAGAIAAAHLRLQMRSPEHRPQALRDLEDAARLAASQVEDRVARLGGLEGEHTAAREVAHVYEITLLSAVLENHGRAAVEIACGENGEHSRVGIRQGLALAVDVEETQRHHREVVAAPEHQAHHLLVVLRQGVDRLRRCGLALRCWNRLERLAVLVSGVPAASLELLDAARPRARETSVGRAIEAFAVDAHAG